MEIKGLLIIIIIIKGLTDNYRSCTKNKKISFPGIFDQAISN